MIVRRIFVKSSTPSCIYYELVAHGGRCPRIFTQEYRVFSLWKKTGISARIHDTFRERVGVLPGRPPIDSQSVKTTEKKGARGYNAGEKVKGRKRHLLVDTKGLLLSVVVHTANIQDRDGAKLVAKKAKATFPTLKHTYIWKGKSRPADVLSGDAGNDLMYGDTESTAESCTTMSD